MYKRRFNAWGVGKNAKRKTSPQHDGPQGDQKNTGVLGTGAKGGHLVGDADSRELARLRNLHRGATSEIKIKSEDRPTTMPPIYCRKRSPEPSSSGLYAPDSPKELLLADRWMLIVRNYVPAAFEMGLWKLQSGGTIVFNQQLIGWYNRHRSCQMALAAGDSEHAFRVLNSCMEECKDVVKSEDPLLLLFIIQGLFPIARHGREVAAVAFRYVRDITRVVHPAAYHPVRLMMEHMHEMGLDEVGRNAGVLLRPYLELIFRALGPHIEPLAALMALISSALSTKEPEMLAVASRTHQGTVERMAAFGNGFAFEILGLKLTWAWNLIRRGLLAHAQEVVAQVLESEEAASHPNLIVSCHQLRFHMAFLERNHEETVAAARRWIDYSTEAYGLGNYTTVDALGSLESYLRRMGDRRGAEETLATLLAATRELKRTREMPVRTAKKR